MDIPNKLVNALPQIPDRQEKNTKTTEQIITGPDITSLGPTLAKPEASPSPRNWLNNLAAHNQTQHETTLNTIGLLNYGSSYPYPDNVESLLKYISQEYLKQTKTPFTNYTNPKTETYKEVLAKILNTLKKHPHIGVLYKSEAEKWANSRSVAILVAETHGDQIGQTNGATFLLDLYKDPSLHLSSGFLEGNKEQVGINKEGRDLLSRQFPGCNDQQIIDQLGQNGFQQITMLRMMLSNKQLPECNFKPETWDISKTLISILRQVLAYEINCSPSGEDININKQHCLKVLVNLMVSFEKQEGLEFFVALSLLTRKILDQEMQYPEALKQKIYEKFFDNFLAQVSAQYGGLDLTQHKIRDAKLGQALLQEIRQDRSLIEKTGVFLDKIELETNKARDERNINIANDFAKAGEGSRIMVVGKNHVRGSKNLIDLLEEREIPVIVLNT